MRELTRIAFKELLEKRRTMEALSILQEKIETLIAVVKDLKGDNAAFCKENDALKSENDELMAENAKIAEGNAQLTAQLQSMEDSILVESDNLRELKKERTSTRSVLDELIKSIDSIVELEI